MVIRKVILIMKKILLTLIALAFTNSAMAASPVCSRSSLEPTLRYLMDEKQYAQGQLDFHKGMVEDISKQLGPAKFLAYSSSALGLAVPSFIAGAGISIALPRVLERVAIVFYFMPRPLLHLLYAPVMAAKAVGAPPEAAAGVLSIAGVIAGIPYKISSSGEVFVKSLSEYQGEAVPQLSYTDVQQLDADARESVSKFVQMHHKVGELAAEHKKIYDHIWLSSAPFGFNSVTEIEMMLAESQGHLGIAEKKLSFINSSISLVSQLCSYAQ